MSEQCKLNLNLLLLKYYNFYKLLLKERFVIVAEKRKNLRFLRPDVCALNYCVVVAEKRKNFGFLRSDVCAIKLLSSSLPGQVFAAC